jgi:glutathione synthase/RimK-type ligase-like ATP-grasp enzyme
MRLALLTCSNLPLWEQDDRFLHQALDIADIEWSLIPWDASEDWTQYDAALIRTTWDYVNRVGEFESTLSSISRQTRLLNPIEVVRWNLRKTYLRVLSERGIPIAPTIWIDSVVDLSDLMILNRWERGFLKPIVGASASDTRRFTRQEVAVVQDWLDTHLQQGQSFMLQPYIDTVETIGEVSLIYFGRVFSHVVQKIPVSGDYRVQDDYGARDCAQAIDDYPHLLEISQHVLEVLHAQFDDLLVSRLDFLLMPNGQAVVNEVELIEPSLFFRHAPRRGPEILIQQLRSLIQS